MGHDESQLVAASPATQESEERGGAAASTNAILVLGMHRSGTSALASLLASMGAFAGDQSELLLPHPQDNPAGYWERRELMLAHDAFFLAIGRAWDRVA